MDPPAISASCPHTLTPQRTGSSSLTVRDRQDLGDRLASAPLPLTPDHTVLLFPTRRAQQVWGDSPSLGTPVSDFPATGALLPHQGSLAGLGAHLGKSNGSSSHAGLSEVPL